MYISQAPTVPLTRDHIQVVRRILAIELARTDLLFAKTLALNLERGFQSAAMMEIAIIEAKTGMFKSALEYTKSIWFKRQRSIAQAEIILLWATVDRQAAKAHIPMIRHPDVRDYAVKYLPK